jgi:hypothetical protein
MAASKRIVLYLVIPAFLLFQNALYPAPGYPCCRMELTIPHARRTYFIGHFISEDEGIYESADKF